MNEFLIENIPYLPQLNNRENPYGSCNVTSMSMCLGWGGIDPILEGEQIEDVLYNFLLEKKYSRHYPYDLARGTNEFREKYFPENSTFVTLRTDATWQDIEKHISAGKPCVVHGWFTKSGHIVTIVGKYGNGEGWLVNDPYGEWFDWGYDTSRKGEALKYSHKLMDSTCGPNGTIWCHFFDSIHPIPFPKIENRYRSNEKDVTLQKIYDQKLEVFENEINNYSVLVKQMQIRLKTLQFKPGETDSIWGEKTKSAYFDFCKKYDFYPEFPLNSKIAEMLIEAK